MFSRRAGNNLVRLLHPFKNAQRHWYCLVLILVCLSALGVGELSAKLRDISSANVTTVSAASFEPTSVAPDSIVAAYGSHLAISTATAFDTDPNTPGIQLPINLAGTTVEVNNRRAGLFFVSSGQINFVMPVATEPGTATVVIKSGDGTISNGTVQVAQVAPGIFSANSTGRGVAAATLLRVKSDGAQSYESISQYMQGDNRYITKPIDLGPPGERAFLILFLSGIRKSDDPNGDKNVHENIRVLIGGIEVTPIYAGRQGDFVGLDQINVEIPRILEGRGIVNVSVSATGFSSSNLVDIDIAGTGGVLPPQVRGFSASALAGQALLINGAGFSSTPTDNIVRISGLEAKVMEAQPTQLRVMVPFGVESGTVSVRTATGEGVSTSVLPVRTSISGLVENTARQPLSGVTVKIANTTTSTITNDDGAFVLPDISQGNQIVEVDGGSLEDFDPPYPKVTLKVPAHANRDNQITRAIALQQSTGSSGSIGVGSGSSTEGRASGQIGAPESIVSIGIQTGDFQLEFPDDVTAIFPGGATSGRIFLTPLLNGRTPFELPQGIFSSSIVQITPFGVRLSPGGKLVFPNKDGFSPGVPTILYRYDPDQGRFVQDSARASVTADGKFIETEPGAIKITSYYFAAIPRQTTTITGRVFEKDGRTVISKVVVRFRGQEASTDGNGSYVLRFVPVRNGEDIAVEASFLRANGRVERAQSATVTPVVLGITRVPDILLQGDTENRPPTVLAPPKIDTEEGKSSETKIIVTDPDVGQSVQVVVDGSRFASIIKSTMPGAYFLRLAPGYSDAGEYTVRIIATDSLGVNARDDIKVVVKDVNRPPAAKNQSITVDEDKIATIHLDAVDPDGDRLIYTLVNSPTHGELSGNGPALSYKPAQNFNGADRLTFKVSDGKLTSNTATVSITVRPVNDAPVITAPGPQTVNEGQQHTFTVSATDPDTGQSLTITTVDTLPAGASLTPVSASSSLFNWTPNYSQAGIYKIVFKVADNDPQPLFDFKEVQITVNDFRVLSVPDAQKVSEGKSLMFNVSTVIPNPNQNITITANGLPEGAVLSSQTTTGRQFRWTPGFTQAGNYTVTFKAVSQGSLGVNETKELPITVLDTVRDLARETAPFTIFGAAGPLPQTTGDDGDGLGESLATGDLNGDSIPDLAVGAPFVNGKGINIGQVYVFFGKKELGGTIDLARQSADVTIAGEANEDHFGASLRIGDINGDGKNDLIVGAPMANVGNVLDAGKVYGLFGNLAPGTLEIEKVANLTITGQLRGDHFGESLALGFIHTKSGPAVDLIVGSPGYDPSVSGGSQLTDAGAVFGFFGGNSLPKTLEARAGNFIVTGSIAGGQLGATLAVGNFNGDDFADFAISAPLANKAAGMVYLALGSERLNLGSASALQSFTGPDEGDNLGTALTMGDLNGDGKADLMIGAPGGDGPSNSRPDAGEVYLIYGGANITGRTADLIIYGVGTTGDGVPDKLGTSLGAGDFTGDGIVDLVIGSPGADNVDSKRKPNGAVYLVFGGSGPLAGILDFSDKPADMTVYGGDSGDSLGDGSVAIANINGGDTGDLILGIRLASSLNNSRPGAGEVSVIWGVKR